MEAELLVDRSAESRVEGSLGRDGRVVKRGGGGLHGQ